MAKTFTPEMFEGLTDAELNSVRAALVKFSGQRSLTADERKALDYIRKEQSRRRADKAALGGVDLLSKLGGK